MTLDCNVRWSNDWNNITFTSCPIRGSIDHLPPFTESDKWSILVSTANALTESLRCQRRSSSRKEADASCILLLTSKRYQQQTKGGTNANIHVYEPIKDAVNVGFKYGSLTQFDKHCFGAQETNIKERHKDCELRTAERTFLKSRRRRCSSAANRACRKSPESATSCQKSVMLRPHDITFGNTPSTL